MKTIAPFFPKELCGGWLQSKYKNVQFSNRAVTRVFRSSNSYINQMFRGEAIIYQHFPILDAVMK